MNNSPTRGRPLEFEWVLHDRCNYRCPYCCVSGGAGSSRPRKINSRRPGQWIDAWKRVYGKYGHCFIRVTGGEPTIFDGFMEIMVGLTRLHTVSFDTNLSWEECQIEEFTRKIPPEKTTLDISFHPYAAGLQSVTAKASLLRDRGFKYVCRLVAFPPLLPRVKYYHDAFSKAGLRFTVNPFNGTHNGLQYPRAYTAEERDFISGLSGHFLKGPSDYREQAFFVRHGLNLHADSTAGRLCSSGQLHGRVTPEGDVYRCQPYEEKNWEPLGSIFDGEFSMRCAPAPCRARSCQFEYKYLVDNISE